MVAPTCSDCHGFYDIRRKSNPESVVNRLAVPATCGKCREGVQRHYVTSVHVAGLKALSLSWIGVHVRLLLVIPLFFACEAFVGPGIAEFARNLRESRLVSEKEWPVLAAIVGRVRWLANGWAAELLLFLLAFGAPLYEAIAGLPMGTVNWSPVMDQSGVTPVSISGWYLMYCMPLFRFLAFRWLWRLSLWYIHLEREQ